MAPEGSALLAIEGVGNHPNPLWQVPLPTGGLRRLGTIDAQGASFFPDGRILFGRGEIFTSPKRMAPILASW